MASGVIEGDSHANIPERHLHGASDLEVYSPDAEGLNDYTHESHILQRYTLDQHSFSELDATGQTRIYTAQNTELLFKRIRKSDPAAASGARRVIASLSAIPSSRGVPRLVEWAEFDHSLLTIVETPRGIPLREYIQGRQGLPAEEIKSLATQLFSAVAIIFNAGFAHLGLCDRTVTVDDGGILTVTDFENAYEYAKGLTGDVHAAVEAEPGGRDTADIFTAPEVFGSLKYNARKATMWSCGVIMYLMCTGQTERLSTGLAHPAGENQTDTGDGTTASTGTIPAAMPAKAERKLSTASRQALKVPVVTYPDRFGVPAYARDVISKMLQVEPARRAELIEVVAKVPKEAPLKDTRPLMELAWLDYKSHVGPSAGLGDSDGSSLFSFGGASVFSRDSLTALLPGSGRRKSSAVAKNGAAAAAEGSDRGKGRRRSWFV